MNRDAQEGEEVVIRKCLADWSVERDGMVCERQLT